MALLQSNYQIVKLNSGQLGVIIECDTDKHQYKIRVLTPLFDDYEFTTLSSTQFEFILEIRENSKIHHCGLFALTNVDRLEIVFKEPILIPFSPRIHNDNDKTIVSEILEWWNHINKDWNKNKLNIFMNLSHHNIGPIVANIDTFISQNKIEMNKMEINKLRKALLIDGTNTFDDGSYEIICRINHCCDPNCFVTRNGRVKSLRCIHQNEELLWNFLNDTYLYKSRKIRIERMHKIWGFICNCFRCNAQFDDVRIFKCMKCSKPSVYVSYDIDIDIDIDQNLNISTMFHDCAECNYKLQKHEIEYYLSIEHKMDKVIGAIDINEIEIDFEERLQHFELYLSDNHFKWFELWNSMVFSFDGRDEMFGKTLCEVLMQCYEVMDKIYNNSINYCRYEIEWKLLNCLIDAKCIQSHNKLLNKLYDSIDETKNIFTPIDDIKWTKITQNIKGGSKDSAALSV